MYIKCNKSSLFLTKDRELHNSPILFIHGFTGSSKSWDAVRDNIDYPSFAIDIPGHHKSTFNNLKDDYYFNDFTNELYITLKKINIKTIHLCGYSLGGRLAICFAAKYPHIVESLVLESTSIGIENREDRNQIYDKDLNISTSINENLKEFISNWETNNLFADQEIRNKLDFLKQRTIRLNHTKEQLSYALKIFSVGRMPFMLNNFQKFNFPISIINGKDDIKYIKKGRDMLKLNNKAKQYIIDQASHNVHMENVHLYTDILSNNIK